MNPVGSDIKAIIQKVDGTGDQAESNQCSTCFESSV